MKICFITNKYPNKYEQNALVFYQQLIHAIADLGHECSVICPTQVPAYAGLLDLPYASREETAKGSCVRVFRPKALGLGQARKIFGKSPVAITCHGMFEAAKKVLIKEQIAPDAFYGHFLAPAGVVSCRLGRFFDKPAFVAYGEATHKTMREYGREKLAAEFVSASGFVAVSSQNKGMLVDAAIDDGSRIGVFPNSFDPNRFSPHDKKESRRALGFPEDAFIVGYCGVFDSRKGVDRLEQAVDGLDGVYFACAGSGSLTPTSPKCIFSQPIENASLAIFYSAMDAFVLPTRREGCCNAIIEAMACGLPIVSSDKSFNDDILSDDCSIRIDVDDVEAIRRSIEILKEDKVLLRSMSDASLRQASNFLLNERAANIVAFMEQRGGLLYA